MDRWVNSTWLNWLPGGAVVASVLVLVLLLSCGRFQSVSLRLPEAAPESSAALSAAGAGGNSGTLTKGSGTPGEDTGSWPQFRGPERTGSIAVDAKLYRTWPADGPRKLWSVHVGEGHAGPAVRGGRVYIVDYDREKKEDAIRCLSLVDGSEIWRYTYSVNVKRNHGMSRTVPSVTEQYVVAVGPKCHVCCLKADTGEVVWRKDLVRELGTVVPPWYAGQCPLVDGDTVVLAPGGDPLMMGVDLATGEVRWRTPNPGKWGMTHSSIVILEHAAGKQYVYCTTRGVVGVSATDGALLWQEPGWKISIANVPTPLPVAPDTLLFTGGYNAGAMLARVEQDGDAFAVRQLFRSEAKVFGSDQQTPLFHNESVIGVLPSPSGELACLSLDGTVQWTSGRERTFGLGPYLAAGDLLYVLDDKEGVLHLVDLGTDQYRELARADILDGHDAWGPMALVGGRLLARDLESLVCLQVGELASE